MAAEKHVHTQIGENKMPSLGNIIHQYLKNNKINSNRLSLKMNRHSTAMAKFKKQTSFQTAILWELCYALKYNFFMDLALQLPKDFDYKSNTTTQELIDLKNENELLKRDIELLEKILKNRA